jgi:hypothetical protein
MFGDLSSDSHDGALVQHKPSYSTVLEAGPALRYTFRRDGLEISAELDSRAARLLKTACLREQMPVGKHIGRGLLVPLDINSRATRGDFLDSLENDGTVGPARCSLLSRPAPRVSHRQP